MENPEVEAALALINKSEHAKRLEDNGMYKPAQQMWLELFDEHEEVEKKLDSALKIAKCDLNLNKQICDGNLRRISDVLQQMELSGKDIVEMAKKKEDVEYIFLSFVASVKFAQKSDPNIRLQNLFDCINQVRIKFNILKQNQTYHPMILKLLSLLQKMVKMMQEIEGADGEDKAKKVAKGLHWIVFLMIKLKKFKDSIPIAKEGLELMKKQFQSNANEHRLVAELYNNMAWSHEHFHNYAEAVRCYAQAIPAREEATDINENERRKWINNNKKYLKQHFGQLNRSDKDKVLEEFPRIGAIIEEGEASSATSPKLASESETVEHRVSNQTVYVGEGIHIYRNMKLKNEYNVFLGEMGEKGGKFKVAVKRLEYNNEAEAKKCDDELERLCRLKNHSTIVGLKHSSNLIGEVCTYKYIAMELCDKNTLQEIITNENPDHKYRLIILRQLVDGLSHIHKHGIVHGDLKPPNILRSLDGKNIKISDFGLSHMLEDEKSYIIRSSIAGTLGWLVPDDVISQEGDIFSLGLVFYFTLTGKQLDVYQGQKPNFSAISCPDSELAEDPLSKMLEPDRKQRPSISEVQPDPTKDQNLDLGRISCPDAEILKHLLQKMLAWERKERPSIEEVVQHPFFWEDEGKLQFICEVSDALNPLANDSDPVKKLESYKDEGFNWVETMQDSSSPELQAKKKELNALHKKAIEKVRRSGELKYDPTSLYSLVRFIRNRQSHFQDDGKCIQYLFVNKDGIWRIFSLIFPNLLPKVYNFALECNNQLSEINEQLINNKEKPLNFETIQVLLSKQPGMSELKFLWTDKKKLRFVSQVVENGSHNIRSSVDKYGKYIFGDDWLPKLILNENEVEDYDKSLTLLGSRYKIQSHIIYNKAVGNIDIEEMGDKKRSVFSLLEFINLVQQGRKMQLMFGGDPKKIWNFFNVRFPNLFSKVHEALKSSKSKYQDLLSSVSMAEFEQFQTRNR